MLDFSSRFSTEAGGSLREAGTSLRSSVLLVRRMVISLLRLLGVVGLLIRSLDVGVLCDYV